MRAHLLDRICTLPTEREPLRLAELDDPTPGPGEVLIRVRACGVCHTELDEIEGRTPPPVLPVVPGHQAVGEVVGRGAGADRHAIGDRVGVAWIHAACGNCSWCRADQENLCPYFRATGRDVHGGYAELMVVGEDFAHPIPTPWSDAEAAPLLCAGAIGWRSLRLAGFAADGDPPVPTLGLTGFGASAHLVLLLVRHRWPGVAVHVFARSPKEQAFARELGAAWAGHTEAAPPEPLHAVIDTTPAWKPVVAALAALRPGGRLVINAIRKEGGDREALAGLDYPTHLWLEKELKSVANVARRDVTEFLELAAAADLRPRVETYPFDQANRALLELKERRIRGAKVLVVA